jgi:cytochrome b subunit of formate dehydrogenase
VVPGAVPGSHLVAGPLEQTHVHEVYDSIALHWHHTRGKRRVHWHSVKAFLEALPVGTLLAGERYSYMIHVLDKCCIYIICFISILFCIALSILSIYYWYNSFENDIV